MNDLISVIVPIYKVEKYLDECVESIVNQTYKNLEVILVDDGSPDRCPEMCDEWARKDSRIKVIHKVNCGLSEARNAGMDIARGTYWVFVDSDDWIDTDCIEYLYNKILRNDADMSVCQSYNIDEEGHRINGINRVNEKTIVGNNECMTCFMCSRDISTTAWGKLYKANLFQNIRYPVGKYHEDVFTTYKVVALCKRINICEDAKYAYRVRENSIIMEGFKMKHLDAIEANLERLEFMKIKYPKLVNSAKAGIVYSVNQCVLRIVRTKNIANRDVIIDSLQKYYREYEWFYLMGGAHLSAKMFSFVAWIKLRLAIKIYKLVV